ncbi:aminotransferase-like domain-containing protein [Bosea minatitlanensis]|uniref:PLP-dependent aminotransferase family protein n=1 Tax=Bosea minatitlanensis TaxID=128782 RepID=A0ABW0F7G6_9HYPH|nr:PLP-dependent aminotransferase family protein [Bosea minatitlanensis]MCT4493114.1 PLP-dependent aminotransferase family protein [Bosea minatitlanensis]
MSDRRRQTRTEDVMAAIRAQAAARQLAPGERLPSIRRCAAAMRVSPSTVVEAYDRLAAEGLIRARPGSGFYLTGHGLPPLSLARPAVPRAVDPFWVSRQSLDAEADMLKPGCGWLPAGWMPEAALRRGLRALARGSDAVLADYGSTRGSLPLRRLLLGRFGEEGLHLSPEQLLLTNSGTQAVDLICRFLLQPGDTVLVDDPCYFNFRALLRVHRLRLLSVPRTASGPDLAAFEAVVAAERPRLYITNSALHNPTGASLSPQAAYRVLGIAAAHDMTIVEDDIFADFEPEPSPRLAVLDGLERVIRVGSFSKTLSASVRCGYVAARPDWIEGLVDLQIATSFGGPSPLAAGLVADILASGGYRKHMEEIRRRLAQARRAVAPRLEGLGITPWLMPRGGFYLWCRLPEGADPVRLSHLALAEGVVLAPGNVFSVAQTAGDFMRFNVAQMGEPRVYAVLERALRALRQG